MQARHLALIASAALVTAGGIYLFWAVRSTDSELPSAEQWVADRTSQARPGVRHHDGDPSSSADEDRAPPEETNDAVFAKDRAGRPRHPRGIPGPTSFGRPGPRREDAPLAEPASPPFEGAGAPDLAGALLEANKAYDRKDFETARRLALALLEKQVPGNVRMLRVVIASSCILGEVEVAQKYVAELPPRDRDQMTRRCAQYGITLP